MSHAISWGDRLSRIVVRRLDALPGAVKRALRGAPVVIDGQTLDEDAQLGVRLLGLAVGETFEVMPLERGRAQIRAEAWIFGAADPVAEVQEVHLATRDGSVPARIYTPRRTERPLPALVYFHGGGWVLGDLSSADSVCRFLCEEAGMVVVSVDYRLAPEHKFPAAVHDAVDSFVAVAERAEEFGIDAERIAIGGESAGGNLAAVVAQHCAKGVSGTKVQPAFQMLLMPVTDLTTQRRSYDLFGDGYFLTRAQMDWYKAHYLSDAAEARDPRVSPLLAEDVAGVAPAYVAVAGFDVLRDEGEEYARKLAAAGVPTALRRHEGLIHGLVNATGVGRAARNALHEAAGALRVGVAAGSPQARRSRTRLKVVEQRLEQTNLEELDGAL